MIHFVITTAAIALFAGTPAEDGWSKMEKVLRGTETVVAYRAKITGDVLVIEVTHGDTWHTYAMDNPERAKTAEKRNALGQELPTEITVSGGAKAVGPWYQTEPEDLSDPEIGWYTWGFSDTVYFATEIERVSDDPVEVSISAQACSESSCRMVDALKLFPEAGDGKTPVTLDELVEVKAGGG